MILKNKGGNKHSILFFLEIKNIENQKLIINDKKKCKKLKKKTCQHNKKWYVYLTKDKRDIAQPGRALALGARCRRFESCYPDHLSIMRS